MRNRTLYYTLVAVLIVAGALTAVYYANGADWSFAYKTNSMFSTVCTMGGLTVLGLAPYFWLWLILRRSWPKWLTPVVTTAVVVAFVPADLYWAIHVNKDMDGGRYIMLPLLQLAIIFVLKRMLSLFRQRQTPSPSSL